MGQRPVDHRHADGLAKELIRAIEADPDKMYVDDLTTAALVDLDHTVEELHQMGKEPYNDPSVEFMVCGAQHGVEAVVRAGKKLKENCQIKTYPSRIFAIGGLAPSQK